MDTRKDFLDDQNFTFWYLCCLNLSHWLIFVSYLWKIGMRGSGGSRIYQTGGGRQPQRWAENLLFGHIFPKNCMKMKEIGPRGGASLVPPLDPPLRGAFSFKRDSEL